MVLKWLLLVTHILMTMSRASKIKSEKYFTLHNPTMEQYCLLLCEDNLDKIFIDLSGSHIRQIQLLSRNRLLYLNLQKMDQGQSRTFYDYFEFPDSRLDQSRKVIHIFMPRTAHILLLISTLCKHISQITFTSDKPTLVLKNLPPRLEKLLSSGQEYSTLLTEYLEERLDEFLASDAP